MKDLKAYDIQFVGLKQGHHRFDYEIENSFFEHYDFDEFNDVDIKLELGLEKKSTLLELEFKAKGSVNVNCDLTNEPYDQSIDNQSFFTTN